MLATMLLLLVPAAWGPAGCPPVGGPRFFAPAPAWVPAPAPVFILPDPAAVERAREEGRRAGRAEGLAEARERAALKRKEEAVKAASKCPCGPGCECALGSACICAGDELPTGVDSGKISERPRYTVSGKEVPRAEAHRAIEQLADDSTKPHLTIIGSSAERRALREAILKDASIAAKVRVQDYPEGHAAIGKHRVKGLTLYLQAPDGKELVREDGLSIADVARLLELLKEALGLATPRPVPVPVPGPNGPPAPRSSDPLVLPSMQPLIDKAKEYAILGWGIAIAAAILWWMERSKNADKDTKGG